MSDKVRNTITWLRVYNGFIAFLYGIILLAFCAIPIIGLSEMDDTDVPFAFIAVCMGAFFLFTFIFFVLYLVGVIKAAEKKKSIWILQIVLVAFGLGSLLTLIPCIFLLLALLSDEVREYYKGDNRYQKSDVS